MSSVTRLRILNAVALSAVLLTGLSAMRLAAQTASGTILGRITDASGGAIPDAKVQIKNSGTNATQVTSSDAEGRYRVPALPVGDYEVQSERGGFQTVVHKGITLTVGADVVVDLALPVGQVAQTVTVQGDVSQVETTSSEVSTLIEPLQIRELPLNGRNMEQLILLAPGVTIMQSIGYQPLNGMGNSYSVSGSRTRGQWELLDDNDLTSFQERNSGAGVLGTSLGVDAIAEFHVLTNTYSAQYGGNGAAVISVSKSGTNAWHGSVYEFVRNSALDARNYFDPPKKPEFQKNQFGGTFGGPIVKDKMFFFGNYEGLRQINNPPYPFTLPDAAAHLGYVPDTTGAYKCVNNSAIIYPSPSCTTTIPAAVQNFLAYFPDPTAFSNTINTQPNGNISGLVTAQVNMKSPARENYELARYDWTISSKDSLFARYISDRAHLFDVVSAVPSALAPTGWSTEDQSSNQFFSLEEKHIWSSNLISSSRGTFSRTLTSVTIPANEANPLFSFLGPTTYGFPTPGNGAISITSLTNANFPRNALGGGSNSLIIQNKIGGGEDFFWTKGAHGLRFGASIQRYQTYRFAPPNGGTWTFSTITSFLKDTPTSYSGTCIALQFSTCAAAGFSSTLAAPHQWVNNLYGFYIQDDWKVNNTVTVNLGLRYEPESNPSDTFGTLAAGLNLPFGATYNPLLPMAGCNVAIADPIHPTVPNSNACPPLPAGVTGFAPIGHVFLQNPSFRNLDPRVGIAWDPFPDHKTSVRAGYGIFHAPISPFDYTNGFNSAPAGTAVVVNCSSAPCTNFPTPFQASGSFTPTGSGYDRTNKSTPYMQQYNLTVQREILKNTVLSVGYVGSHGVHLIGLTDLNPQLPTGVPGAITVCASGCTMKPGQVLLPFPAVGSQLTSGACSTVVNGVPTCPGLAAGTLPVSANGQAIVDPSTGQNSYSNVVYTPSTGTYAVVANNRVDPAVSFWGQGRTTFWSRYNSLQVSLVRRLTNNLQGQLSYTWASCVTDSSGSGAAENQLIGADSYNTELDRGRCGFMIAQNLYVNGLYFLPFHQNRLVDGWQMGALFTYHNGTPISISNGWSSSLVDQSGSDTSNRPSNVAGCTEVLGTLARWIDPACYAQPPIGEPGNIRSFTVLGPTSTDIDFSLVKNTKLSERFSLQFRAEAFNIFNHPNFRNAGQPAIRVFSQTVPVPSTCFSTPSTCSTVNAIVGQTTLTNTTSRQIQLGMKVIF